MQNKIKRLPRSIKTVDDLLSRDDVNEAIESLISKKRNIKQLITIYVKDDDSYGIITSEMTNCDILWYLENAKNDILNPQEEE